MKLQERTTNISWAVDTLADARYGGGNWQSTLPARIAFACSRMMARLEPAYVQEVENDVVERARLACRAARFILEGGEIDHGSRLYRVARAEPHRST